MHKDRPERHTGRLVARWGFEGDAVCSCDLATARRSKGEGMDAAAKPSRPGHGGKERNNTKRSKFLAVESAVNLSGLSLPTADLMITGGKFQA